MAFVRCLRNGGVPGVDGQSFDDIEKLGRDQWLDELAAELRTGTHRPQPVRRVLIPKADGKQYCRAFLASETVWYRWLRCWSWNRFSRPTWSPNNTPIARIAAPWTPFAKSSGCSRTGHTEVVDADLSGYFDSIPHAELMKSVSRRISDSRVLRLIKMWLEAAVEETDAKRNRHRTTRNKDQGIATPQGSPISPLFANVYMRAFVKGWKTGGHEQRLDARIINYADDFVICCRGTAEEAMSGMRTMMSKLKLTVNEQKTRAYAACRKSRLIFWVTPSVGTTTAERASPTRDDVPRRRRSTGSVARSMS